MLQFLRDDKRIYSVVAGLALIGIGLAIYLYYNYLIAADHTICSISSTINCSAIITGDLAEWFGVPVSLVGLIGYIIILISSLWHKKKLLFFMTTFGLLFCLRLSILELFVEKLICPICLLCQTIMIIVFALSLKLLIQPEKQETAES